MKLPALKSTSKKRKEMQDYRAKIALEIAKVKNMTQVEARNYVSGKGLIESAHILATAFNLNNEELYILIYGQDAFDNRVKF